jgi:hypothetical protein
MNSKLTSEEIDKIRQMLLRHPSFDNCDEHHEMLDDFIFEKLPGCDRPAWYTRDNDRMFFSGRTQGEVEAYLVNAMLSNLPNHAAFCSLHDGERVVYQVIRSLPPDHSERSEQYVCTTIPILYAVCDSPIEALAEFWKNY